LIGFLRILFGAVIVALALAFRDSLGEIWTGGLVLLGAVIGVSGTASVLLVIAYYLVIPFVYIGFMWLLSDVWRGSYYTDTLARNYGYLYFFWSAGLLTLPLIFYYANKSWFFMVNNFSLDEEPADTPYPELFAVGVVDLTGDPYLAAATITEQGLILDRRNFAPVILPWKWVTSVEPSKDPDPRFPSAVVAMRNDDDEFLTLTVPWNEDLLKLNAERLAKPNA
jgi:hypothetical protein